MSHTVSMLTNDEKTAVNNFMVNFMRANIDSEVKFVKAKRDNGFIRVTVTQNGNQDWYHVTQNGNHWY